MLASSTTVRVRYAEVDRLGAVNSARYFEWFELGQSDLLRSAGLPYGALEEKGIALPLVEAHCRCLAKLGYDEVVRIEASLDVLSPERLAFRFRVFRVEPGAETLAAEGETVHKVLGPSGTPLRLPPEILAVLAPG
jgi:acyl-CoA thioester hydrolase